MRWPHRKCQAIITAYLQCAVKTFKNRRFKKKRRFENRYRSPTLIPAYLQVILTRRSESLAHMQSPWPRQVRPLESDECLEDRAAARIAAFLEGGRAQGARIHCKYAVNLFCGQARGRRRADGTFSPSWGVLWCLQGPKKMLRIF